MRTKVWGYFLAVCAVGCLGLATNAYAADADGAALYKKQCKKCHGEDGKGVEKMLKPLKLTDQGLDALSLVKQSAKDMSDDDMLKLLREGRGKKKPTKVEKLDDASAKLVIAHVRTLQK